MSFAAVILAGSRGGAGGDAVAVQEGVSHKALARLGGTTLLHRVALALQVAGAARVAVSASDPDVIAAAEALGLELLPAAHGPSDSVGVAIGILGTPLVVATADHALLHPDWIAALRDGTGGADVAVMLARRDLVEAAAPGTRRTWLRFADGDWSGCNLFHLATPAAVGAIGLWRQVEADRKRPWRIVAKLGPGLLVRYLTGRLTLADALARLGRRAGVVAAMVPAPDGRAAIDVDTIADLALVRSLSR